MNNSVEISMFITINQFNLNRIISSLVILSLLWCVIYLYILILILGGKQNAFFDSNDVLMPTQQAFSASFK